jgi:PAS domain S-box-containing protein
MKGLATEPSNDLGEIALSTIYEQAFDNALVGICFMADRHFVRVNRQMEAMLGYGPGELTGKCVRAVYASQDDYEDVGHVLQTFPKDNRYIHERPLVTKSGGTLWCLISGSFVARGRSDSASVWIVQDISARKRAENQLTRTKHKLEQIVERRTLNVQRMNKALRQEIERRRESDRSVIESREKYRVLIRNAPLGIILTDDLGKIIEINPASMRMFGAADPPHFDIIAGRSTAVRERSRTPEIFADFLMRMIPKKGRRLERQHFAWRDVKEEPRWFEAIGVGIPVRGLGCAILLDDKSDDHAATEREHVQREQLAHAGRVALVGQFASAIAHELGQPLNACQSYAAGIENELREALAENPGAKDALRRIQQHLEQSGEIIRNVRAFVGKQRTSDETVTASILIDQTIDLLLMSLQGVEMRVEATPTAQSIEVRGNRVELQQVLVNLIINAVDAMRDFETPSPKIEIRLTNTRKKIAISVVDNGPGVPSTIAEEVFKPYVTTKKGGLGMGLMMSRTIVESHGGSLLLKPSRGRGARFDITLPIAQ